MLKKNSSLPMIISILLVISVFLLIFFPDTVDAFTRPRGGGDEEGGGGGFDSRSLDAQSRGAKHIRDMISQHFAESDEVFSKQKNLDARHGGGRRRDQRGERSLTGRLDFDNDLSRLRYGAIAQHSFIPPLLQPGASISAGMTTVMQYWEPFRSTVVTDNYVRLTPHEGSRDGVIWNTVPSASYSWTAHIGFRVHDGGAGGHMGGDGFAVWYQRAGQDHNLQRDGGSAHGLNPAMMHDGFGIVFDTFDNDGAGDNPGVTVVKTIKIPRGRDRPRNLERPEGMIDPSADYKGDERLGHCYRPFRNTDQPEHVVIKYNFGKQQLIVSFADQHCVVAEDFKVLPLGFFGISAHTGGVADMHDIHYFIVTSNDDEEEEEAIRTQDAEGKAAGTRDAVAPADVTAQDLESVDHGTSGEIQERRHPVHGKKVLPGKVKYNPDLDKAEREKWSGYVEPKDNSHMPDSPPSKQDDDDKRSSSAEGSSLPMD